MVHPNQELSLKDSIDWDAKLNGIFVKSKYFGKKLSFLPEFSSNFSFCVLQRTVMQRFLTLLDLLLGCFDKEAYQENVSDERANL